MNRSLKILSLLTFGVFGFATLHAQAPAGAPAGATGICKDGSYSTQASKTGACRGHKGVQTWYAAAGTKARTTDAAQPSTDRPQSPASMGAPQNRPATPPTAAPAPPPPPPAEGAATATRGKRMSPEQAAANRPMAPGGGPGMVWANEDSKVYHCSGDPFYGRTKKGVYLSESDAKAKGFHGARGKSCGTK